MSFGRPGRLHGPGLRSDSDCGLAAWRGAPAGKGRSGERYILGSENLTLAQILQKLARITGRKAPTIRLPYLVAYCAGACSTAWAGLSGKPPRVPLDAVRMAKKKMWVTHEKARRELDFQPAPADQALARAVEWFTRASLRPAA